MPQNTPQQRAPSTETGDRSIDDCPDINDLLSALRSFETAVLDYCQYGQPALDRLVQARADMQEALYLRCLNSTPLTPE